MIEYMPEMTITSGIYTYSSEDPGKGKQTKEYHGRVVKEGFQSLYVGLRSYISRPAKWRDITRTERWPQIKS